MMKIRDWINVNKIDWKYLSHNDNAIEILIKHRIN